MNNFPQKNSYLWLELFILLPHWKIIATRKMKMLNKWMRNCYDLWTFLYLFCLGIFPMNELYVSFLIMFSGRNDMCSYRWNRNRKMQSIEKFLKKAFKNSDMKLKVLLLIDWAYDVAITLQLSGFLRSCWRWCQITIMWLGSNALDLKVIRLMLKLNLPYCQFDWPKMDFDISIQSDELK